MRAYVRPHKRLSRAMERVADALEASAPEHGFEAVRRPEDAELVILHVIGYPETAKAAEELLEAGKRYAMLQYCLRSTQRPDTSSWADLWRSSAGVWSYYDLDTALITDGIEPVALPLYRAPLGVDGAVFYPRLEPADPASRYAILTSGYVARTEAVNEAAAAVRRAGRRGYHLGPDLGLGAHMDRGLDITDEQLAGIYSRCDYVAGLRRAEGFELPAAEGLLCGARPVCFDRPHYRDHYGRWAVFVSESSPDILEDALYELIANRDIPPLELEELEEAREYFSWPRVTGGFWRTINITIGRRV